MIKQMPELPDIQVYVEQLAKRLVGQPLTAVTIAKLVTVTKTSGQVVPRIRGLKAPSHISIG